MVHRGLFFFDTEARYFMTTLCYQYLQLPLYAPLGSATAGLRGAFCCRGGEGKEAEMQDVIAMPGLLWEKL